MDDDMIRSLDAGILLEQCKKRADKACDEMNWDLLTILCKAQTSLETSADTWWEIACSR